MFRSLLAKPSGIRPRFGGVPFLRNDTFLCVEDLSVILGHARQLGAASLPEIIEVLGDKMALLRCAVASMSKSSILVQTNL